MTTPPEPHKPAFPIRAATLDNPWAVVLWFLTGITLLAGVIAISSTPTDPTERDFNQANVDLAHLLLGTGAMMLVASLAAGAICWQLARR